jgi:hypothetical protein
MNDRDARRFVGLVAGLHPAVARPLIHYLALFRPAKTGMRWSRMLSLAQELVPQIQAAQVSRGGVTHVATTEMWGAALQQLADRPPHLRLPLKSHGYLLEVVAGLSERAASVAEREVEDNRRRGDGRAVRPAAEVGQIAERAIAPDPNDWREQMLAAAQQKLAPKENQE